MSEEDQRLRCDDCGELIQNSLIDTETGPDVKLACACHAYEPTTGRHVPFGNDIPDKWWDGEIQSPWDTVEGAN